MTTNTYQEKIDRGYSRGKAAGKAGKNSRPVLRYIKDSPWYNAWLDGWRTEVHPIYHDIDPTCWSLDQKPVRKSAFGAKTIKQAGSAKKGLELAEPCSEEKISYGDSWIWIKMKTNDGDTRVVAVYQAKSKKARKKNTPLSEKKTGHTSIQKIIETLHKQIDPDPYSQRHEIRGVSPEELLDTAEHLESEYQGLKATASALLTAANSMLNQEAMSKETYEEIEFYLSQLLEGWEA